MMFPNERCFLLRENPCVEKGTMTPGSVEASGIEEICLSIEMMWRKDTIPTTKKNNFLPTNNSPVLANKHTSRKNQPLYKISEPVAESRCQLEVAPRRSSNEATGTWRRRHQVCMDVVDGIGERNRQRKLGVQMHHLHTLEEEMGSDRMKGHNEVDVNKVYQNPIDVKFPLSDVKFSNKISDVKCRNRKELMSLTMTTRQKISVTVPSPHPIVVANLPATNKSNAKVLTRHKSHLEMVDRLSRRRSKKQSRNRRVALNANHCDVLKQLGEHENLSEKILEEIEDAAYLMSAQKSITSRSNNGCD